MLFASLAFILPLIKTGRTLGISVGLPDVILLEIILQTTLLMGKTVERNVLTMLNVHISRGQIIRSKHIVHKYTLKILGRSGKLLLYNNF